MRMKNRIKNSMCALLLMSGAAFSQQPNCVYMEEDIYPGSYGSAPNNIVEYNGALYFACTGNAQGLELWKLEDGVTSMVADINPGFAGSFLNQLTVVGPYLYFSANNGASGIELFRYDGTSVTLMADIYPGVNGSFVDKLTAVGTDLYFFAMDGVNGFEPWKFDGTTATMIADIYPGSIGCNPVDIAAYGGDIFFAATNPTYGQELWKYDGVTVTVFDLYPGATGSDVNELTSIGTKLCFRATDGVLGYELWTYDGVSVVNLDANPSGDFTPWELTAMGGTLFCRGVSPTAGYELFKYDGTTCSLVQDIRPGTPNASPNNLTVVDGTHLYFAANDGTTGNELWHYDGTTCALAADIRTGSSGSMPVFFIERMASVNNHVFMVAANATSGYEVWHYDGSTIVLEDVVPGTGSSNPSALKGIGSKMYWVADDMVAGGELWVWDVYADLTDTINVTTCGDYTSPGGDVYSAEGVYNFTDTLTSVVCTGCDSLVNVNLTISQPDADITVIACNSYTSPAGNVYNVEGTYNFVDIIPSVACPGVDSVITIDLTIIDDISTAVVVFTGVLVAQQSGAEYQWLDCDNGYAPVAGATDQDFLPAVDGSYACEITLGTCSDTTACNFVEAVSDVGVTTNNLDNIRFYPNPVSDLLTLEMPGITNAWMSITNDLGQTVLSKLCETEVTDLDIRHLSPGVYFLIVRTDNAVVVHKIAKR